MDRDPVDALSLCQVEQREQVRVDCVDPTRSDETHKMESPAKLFHLTACTHQGGIGVEAPIGDGRRDSYQILHHHASRPKIEVSDFAVAHLPFGETNANTRCFEERARAASPERVPGRGVGECDCVAVSFGAIAPSIEYDERDWPRAL